MQRNLKLMIVKLNLTLQIYLLKLIIFGFRFFLIFLLSQQTYFTLSIFHKCLFILFYKESKVIKKNNVFQLFQVNYEKNMRNSLTNKNFIVESTIDRQHSQFMVYYFGSIIFFISHFMLDSFQKILNIFFLLIFL